MAMENPPFEDVFILENGNCPASHVGFEGYSIALPETNIAHENRPSQ